MKSNLGQELRSIAPRSAELQKIATVTPQASQKDASVQSIQSVLQQKTQMLMQTGGVVQNSPENFNTHKNLKITNQKTSSSFNNGNTKTPLTAATMDSQALYLAKDAKWMGNSSELTKESKEQSKGNEKEFEVASTKSSNEGKRTFDCPLPTITIRKCGFTSHILPSQMDICIVADTEEADREYYEEPEPEHVNVIENFQDKDFDPVEKQKLIKDLQNKSDDEGQISSSANNQWETTSNGKDYFIQNGNYKYSGNHLLIDLWGAINLDNAQVIEDALRESAIVSGATILHCHLHNFEPNGGISGVLVLSESHISIHSWPERGYAALDVFMCGEATPIKSIPILKKAFKPAYVNVVEARRGLETKD